LLCVSVRVITAVITGIIATIAHTAGRTTR
jgi:hypothetical protein